MRWKSTATHENTMAAGLDGPAAFIKETIRGVVLRLLFAVSKAVSEIMMVVTITDEPEEAVVIAVTEIVEAMVSPDKDSVAVIVGGHACARLSLVSLDAMCRCDARGKEQPEQKRQTRKKCNKPYFETHSTSHFLLKGD